jgi:hypothetical protein
LRRLVGILCFVCHDFSNGSHSSPFWI